MIYSYKNYLIIFFCLLFSFNNSFTFAQDTKNLIFIPSNNSIKEFYIGKFPVTNLEYKKFIDSTNYKAPKYWKNASFPQGKDNHPVIFVSYNDAIEYCRWLESTNKEFIFRLPSISEWEYAASGGNNFDFPWGNQADSNCFNCNKLVASVFLAKNPIVKYTNPKSSAYGQSNKLDNVISINKNGSIRGWIDHKNYTGFVYTDLFEDIMKNGGYTTPVDKYQEGKSPFGVYDMSGNVWEWTSSIITATNGAERGKTVNAIKGGSWYANANSCKIKMSGEGRNPNLVYNTVGFRIVAERRQ